MGTVKSPPRVVDRWQLDSKAGKVSSLSRGLVDPAPRGGIPWPCPPNECLCPPKRWLCPKKINRNWCYSPVFSCTRTGFHEIFGIKTFFLGGHLFSAGKTVWISELGQKIPLNFRPFFGLHLVCLIQTGINFSCPRSQYLNCEILHGGTLLQPWPILQKV